MGAPRNGFIAEYGTEQGRTAPTGWSSPGGTYAMQLGHDEPGVRWHFAAGDSIAVHQTSDISAARKILFRGRQRAPSEMPPGWSWRFRVYLNGHAQVDRTITRSADFEDTAVATEIEIANDGATLPLSYELMLEGPAGEVSEVELPGLWVDDLGDEPSGPAIDVYSRDPEPGEVQIPLTSAVRFTIGHMISGGLLASDINVSIDGTLALTAGLFQPGFTGSIVTVIPSGIYIVTIQPAVPFTPLATISVRVMVPSLGFSTTYSFQAEDTIAPKILSAFAPTAMSVRVTFDEPVLMVNSAGIADALNPANYAIALVSGAPAVTPSVVGVEAMSDRVVELTFDKFMTRGAIYSVTGSNIEDLFGNVIAAPNDVTTFAGYRWPIPEGRRTQLFEMLPEATRRLDETGEHARFLGILQELIDVYFGIADRVLDIIDPDFAPIEWVDLMLSDLGNPFDFLDLTEMERRILAQTLVSIFRRKGTAPGIVSTIRFFLGIDVSIRMYAWSPYPIGEAIIGQTFVLGSSLQSDLYTFEVVTDVFLTAIERKHINAIVDYMKVSHEHWRLVEPVVPVVIDHWQLGFSLLGSESILHP